MNILRSFFGTNPQPGETYVFDNGDPFRKHYCKVLKVIGGWVLYEVNGKELSETIRDFKLLWKKVEG